MSIPETFPAFGNARAPAVYAVIPAYGGPAVLSRVLASLASERPLLRGAIVVNNACTPEIESAADAAPVPAFVVAPACNLGTGGGIAAGLRRFREQPDATHAWILDDDAVVRPGALAALLDALRTEEADAAAPLILEGGERVTWIPCRVPGRPRDFLRRGLTPAEFTQACGDRPRRCTWAIWASVVLSRRAVEATGDPRLELWSQFTDIEYMLRVTRRFACVLVPRAVCEHRPTVATGAGFDAKLFAALQNGVYVALRLRDGRRALRHLPGLTLRYLRHYRWRLPAWRNAAAAWWQGGVRGQPSGRRQQAEQLARAQKALAELPTQREDES